ncbi:MAG: SbcC/MukB-like Walker B domain-containing protein, partial [Gammaproteobacteria bacterium]
TAAELAREDRLYGWVGRLDELVHGNNAQRITLQTYVLSVLLDEVLELASERLMTMSKGRYSVRRREDVTDRRARSGLDLDVEDAYTGQMRPVSTLSGGESFMAALSLALGLSDVIQRHSGGIYLETLFIDEGFGSLDSEALDLAIRMLVELRAGGRTVGVISHVEELKRTITQQIKVVPLGGGSMIT